MEYRRRAFNVFKKFYAYPLPLRRSFDKPRNVRYDEFVICAEMRFKSRKSVICHFAFCRGKLVKKAGLSRVGQPHEADIGDKPKLKMIFAHISRQSLLKLKRR